MQLKDARGPWAGVSPRRACRWPVDGGWRGGRSALPFIRETQIEAAAGCHLAPVRMAIVTKPASNGCRRGRGAGGAQIGAAAVANSVEAPRKIKNRAAVWPSSRTAGYLADEIQDTDSKRCLGPCVHCRQLYRQWPGHGGGPGVLQSPVGARRGAYARWSMWLVTEGNEIAPSAATRWP